MQNSASMKKIFSTILMSIKIIDQSINNKNKIVKTNFFNRQIALLFFFSQSFWSFQNYIFYQFQNSVYQNQNNQYRQSSNDYQQQQKIVSNEIVLFVEKQSFLLQIENEFDSNQKQNNSKFSNDEKVQKSNKIKAYVVDENEKNAEFEKKIQNQQNDDDNYYVSENLNYYESYNESTNDDDAIVYFIMSKMIVFVFFNCRKYNQIFIFNNKLHQHIRKTHLSEIVIIFIVLLTEFNLKQSFASKSSFFIAVTKNNEKFFINVISIINFDVDFNKKVNIDYDFRDWNYDKINVSLFVIDETKSVCLNFDFDITLANRQFFQRQTFDISIRIMISFINVRELKINKHFSTEYVIIKIYFSKQKNNVSTKTKITREIHLISYLKINMLLSNDIIESKRIIFDSSNNVVHIDNCDVSIFLNIKTSRIVVHTSIHARKTMIISSRSEIVVSIHYIIISTDRDFFSSRKKWIFRFMFI